MEEEGSAVEFTEGTLWVPHLQEDDVTARRSKPSKQQQEQHEQQQRVLALDAVVAHRGHTLAALGAAVDPLQETAHAILRYLRLAAELSNEENEDYAAGASHHFPTTTPSTSTATATSTGSDAAATSTDASATAYPPAPDFSQFDEFSRARVEVAQLLDQLFPLFHNRDALLAQEIPQNTPVKQIAWADAVDTGFADTNNTQQPAPGMQVYGSSSTDNNDAAKDTTVTAAQQAEGTDSSPSSFNTPPMPLRASLLERNERLLLVDGDELTAHDVFLRDRHDDYDNSANDPAWQELYTKATHLEKLVYTSCAVNERPAVSLPSILHDAHDQIGALLRSARNGTLAAGGTRDATSTASGVDGDDACGLLDALRITGQGCEFHAVDPPVIALSAVEYLRGRDAREVRVDRICTDYNGLRFVRLVFVANEDEFSSPLSALGNGSGDGQTRAGDTADTAATGTGVDGATARMHDMQVGTSEITNAATLQRLSFSPIDSQTTTEVSFDTQAVFWFATRLFGEAAANTQHAGGGGGGGDDEPLSLIAPSTLLSVFAPKGPICFNVTPAYDIPLLDFLHDRSVAPHVTDAAAAQLALTSMLLLIDDASGSGISVCSQPPPPPTAADSSGGGVFAVHNVSLFRNPVEFLGGDTVVLGWRSPLWCCEWLLNLPIPHALRRRIAHVAPACVLLRWLGDMQMAQDEVDNLSSQDALPLDVDVFSQSIRPGVMIRVHRTFVRMHNIIRSNGDITIGQLLQRLYPVCSQFYEKHRVAAKSDAKKTFTRTQRNDFISKLIPTTDDVDGTPRLLHLENVLEQPIPHLAKIPSSKTSRATANKRRQRFQLVDAVKELLHAPCLDEPGHPLTRYSDACKLELVLHLSAEFPELDRASLPSYWNDPAFFHTLLGVSSSKMCITPHAIWLFRDYINISISGTTPLHQVIRCFSGDLDLVQKQIDFMVRVGADVDGPDRRGMTPVDICAENHPEIFLQLIGLGAHGGSRTVGLSKFYFKLLETNAQDNAPLLAGMQALIERNRQLNWTVSLRQILPPMPGETLVAIRGETVSDRCMREPFFSQLFKNDSFTPRVPRLAGRRSVGAIECGEHWISFKLRPEFPGIEFVAGHLSRALFGDWIAPYVELLRVQNSLPILASSGVAGVTLRHVMEKSPKMLAYLDFQYVSMALLNAMIVSPEDGKPSDYVVEPIEDGKYRIVAVDNERCFCPTSSTEQLVEPSVTPTTRAARKAAPYLRPKCVLFCLDQMLRPVDPEVRDHVLSLDVTVLVRKWLAKAVLVNTSHRALFSPEEAAHLLKGDEPTVIGVPMGKMLPVQILDKLQRMQRILSTSPNATHLDVLRVLEPTQADRYARVLLGAASASTSGHGPTPSVSSAVAVASGGSGPLGGPADVGAGSAGTGLAFTTPYERFLAVDKPLFFEKADHTLRTNISTDDFILAYGVTDIKFVPQLTLPGLDDCPETSRHHVEHALDQRMRRDQLQRTLQGLESDPDALGRLLSAVEQERWIENLDFSVLSEKAQEAVLAVVGGLVLQNVCIRNSLALRDQFVLSKLNLRHVTTVDLSGNQHLQVSARVTALLATQCPRLAHLTLTNLCTTQFVVRRRPNTFPSLKILNLSDCSNLTFINFSAPVLRQLILDGCTSLAVIEISTPQLLKLSLVDCQPEKAHTGSMEDHHLELSSDTDASMNSLQRGMQWAKTRFSFKLSRQSGDSSAQSSTDTSASGIAGASSTATATGTSGGGAGGGKESGSDTAGGSSGSAEDQLHVSRAALDFWTKHVTNASHPGPALASLTPAQHKQAVKLTKSGLPPSLRGDIWLRLTGGFTLKEEDSRLYENAHERRFGQSTPSMLELTRSFFGHFFDFRRIGLDHKQQVSAGRVLCCLAQEYNDTQYCPWLPMIVACSVTCMEEDEVFMMGSALLNREPALIRSRKDTWLMLCTFDDLASRHLPEARNALLAAADFREGDDLRGHPLRGAVLTWFADCLPRQSLLLFVDNFLVKGRKIFYRYALAILRRWFREHIKHDTGGGVGATGGTGAGAGAVEDSGLNWPEDVARAAHDAVTLAQEAFSFHFSTKDIERSEKAAHVAAWNALTVSGLVAGVDEIAMTTTDTPLEGFHASLQLERRSELPMEDSSGMERPIHDSWHSMPLSVPSISSNASVRSASSAFSRHTTATMLSAASSARDTMRTNQSAPGSKTGTLKSATGGGGGSVMLRRRPGRSTLSSSVRTSTSLRRIQQQMQSMFMMVYSEFAQTHTDGGSLEALSAYSIRPELVVCDKKLGQGAFGEVHRGVIAAADATANGGDANLPPPLQRLLRDKDSVVVAVKSVLASAEVEEQAKFLLEARLMVSLRHKHLVAMLGVCHTQLPYLLVLEFLENGSCRDYLRRCREKNGPERLSQDKVRRVGVQIASALAYLHEHRIVHRDLAARNVLVGHSLALVKLADFGLSRALGDDNYYRKKTEEKTPIKWQAPEANTDGVYTPAGDIWSLGVFLWELSTYGKKPYGKTPNAEAHLRVLRGYRLPQTELTHGSLYSVMQQCWSKKPQQRPTSALVRSMLEQAVVSSAEIDYAVLTYRQASSSSSGGVGGGSTRSTTSAVSVAQDVDTHATDSAYMQPVVGMQPAAAPPPAPRRASGAHAATDVSGMAKHHQAAMRARSQTFQLLARVDRVAPPAVPPRHSTMASRARNVQRARLNSNRVSRAPRQGRTLSTTVEEGDDAMA